MKNIERNRSGFTLIELLAVILIVGILATILVTQLGGAEEGANIQTTRGRLAMIEGAIGAYSNEQGGPPPSSFTEEQGVPNDGTNVGVEVLVVTLWSKGYEAGGLLSDVEDDFENTDGDSSSKRLTDFDNRSLLELTDAWGNPIAYFNRMDYEVTNRSYITYDNETGEEVLSAPRAFRDSKTGRYHNPRTFQLISAGADGHFDTEDDITTFERD